MLSTLMSFVALFSAVLLLLMGTSLLGTLLSLRMAVAGVATHVTGMVLAAYYAGLVVGSFLCLHLIERVGHIRAFAAYGAVVTAAVMLHGVHMSPLVWALLRFVTGVATMGLYMVIESWLNECTDDGSRGRVFSIYMVFTYLGLLFGQLLLNVGEPGGPVPFFLAGMLLALCLVPVATTRSVHPRLPETRRFNPAILMRKAPLGMLGCLAAGMISGGFYAMGPVFSSRIGLPVSGVTYFMAAGACGGLLFQWPLGLLSDRMDRSKVLIAQGLLTAGVCLAVMAAAEISHAMLFLATGCFGGLAFTVYPVAVARAHDIFDPEDVIPVSSALLLSYGIGASLGPILAALVMTGIQSPNGLFVYIALVSGGYASIGFYLRNTERFRVVPVEDQVNFVPMRSTSPVVTAIDPRGEPDPESAGGNVQ